MSILITGAAGFFGSHLIPLLLETSDDRLICLDNFNDSYSPERKWANLAPFSDQPRVKIVAGDIRDVQLLRNTFERNQVTQVIHLAAHAGVRRSVDEPMEYTDNNVNGTTAVLEQCRKQPLERVVIASSSTVYGKQATVPFVEDAPLGTPASPYGATKRATELLAQTYHELHGVPAVCIRPFSAIGPRLRPDLGMSIFARTMLAGEPLPLLGDGSVRRDFTHVHDICVGIASALTADNVVGECINLGHDQPWTIRELINLLERELGCQAKIKHLPPNAADLPATCADLTKARRLLNYEPRIDLAQAVREFAVWFRQEGVFAQRSSSSSAPADILPFRAPRTDKTPRRRAA
ncbi:GDP-mannose 4,6-dehydratase [Anatilimnocola floriformis]|uniref:GDP-mannose 4,6-dehydratase n=1 Tax=Anatilimnocola floriformis TaxID=2948575 RepID=UPI0020C41D05|nr:GDP-mannose 4,6-dehydratase [Anatilimnocola floriformis]